MTLESPKTVPRRTEKKAKRPPRCCEVVESFRLTPNMQRVILSGSELEGFTAGQDGANLKICVPSQGQSTDAFRALLADPAAGRVVRTFTVCAYDPDTNRLTIDFALHEPAGHAPAGDWARDAKAGDLLGVMGPGQKKLTAFSAAQYVLHGDMTALPAIGAILADMPREAIGDAFLEITHEDDRQDFDAPAGVRLHWLVHPDPTTASRSAIDAIRTLPLSGSVQVAIIGEHSVVADLKSYFFGDLGLDPAQNYISPYWKIGLVEDEHQALKRAES